MRYIISLWLVIGSLPAITQQTNIGGFAVYYGDLHNHCMISDVTGSVSEAYYAAKNTAAYDFFSLSDHAEQMSGEEWELMKATSDSFNEDGVFAAFWGFEWSGMLHGHVTIIGSRRYCSSLGLITNNFTKLVNWVDDHECIAFFNHPGSYNSLDMEFNHFNLNPSGRFVGMELWNENQGFERYYYNNGFYENDGGLSYYDEALNRGWKIGASGGDDIHDGNWGSNEFNMAVLAHELNRSSIWDALIARRFYSTIDRNIEMSFKINGYEMGSTLHSGSYTGEIRLHDANDEIFVKAELIRNGRIIQTFTMDNAKPLVSFFTEARHSDYFYIRIQQKDGDQAISSPIFIDDAYPVNTLPVVTITDPVDGLIVAPGMITLQADATDIDGFVERVNFYADDFYLGTDTVAPFSLNYYADSRGLFTLTALAFDDKNAVAVSPPVAINVSGGTGIHESTSEKPASIIIQHSNNNQYLLLAGTNKSESAAIADLTGRRIAVLQINPGEPVEVSQQDLRNGLYIIYIVGHPEIRAVKLIW
jgi:hypothetical protein